MSIEVKITGAGAGDGSEAAPFESGGVIFTWNGSYDISWSWKWVIGGQPTDPDMVEAWYKLAYNKLSFSPSPKQTKSMAEITINFTSTGGQTTTSVHQVWIMAFEDEPVPLFSVDCDDGIARITNEQLQYLKSNGLLEMVPPRPKYHGTKVDLFAHFDEDPTDPPTPPPPSDEDENFHYPLPELSGLQMCFAPVHGRDYSVHGTEYTDPEFAILEMWKLGAKTINLWFSDAHLFYDTNSFDVINPHIQKYYDRFLQVAADKDITVIAKLSHWTMPGWFDQRGVPYPGTPKYQKHLEAKKKMAKTLQKRWGWYIEAWMIGNEPQNLATVYPNPPIVDDPDPTKKPVWHTPEDCLQINKDIVKTVAPQFKSAVIAPVSAPSILTIRPDAMDPVEFLTQMKPTLIKYNVAAVNFNPYLATANRKPTIENYVKPHKALADIYPVVTSESNIARPWTSESNRQEWLKVLIELQLQFSPHYSHFLYQDFDNRNYWGIRTFEGAIDPTYLTLQERFGNDNKQVFGLPLRTTENWDTGIHITNLGDKTEVVVVKFFEEAVSGQTTPRQIGPTMDIACPPSAPVIRNVRADLHIPKGAAMVKLYSDQKLAVMGIWWNGNDNMFPVQGYVIE